MFDPKDKDSSMAIGGALKEELERDKQDDSSMAIGGALKEELKYEQDMESVGMFDRWLED